MSTSAPQPRPARPAVRCAHAASKARVLAYIDEMPEAFVVLELTGTSGAPDLADAASPATPAAKTPQAAPASAPDTSAPRAAQDAPCGLRVDYCNRTFAGMLRKRPADCLGRDVQALFGPRHAFPYLDICRAVALDPHGALVKTAEHTLRGRQFSLYFYAPRAGRCACLFRDITEMRLLEARSLAALERENALLLQRAREEERYRLAARQTGAVIFEWDLRSNAFFASDNFRSFALEVPADNGAALLHARNLGAVHPEDRARFAADFLAPLKKQGKSAKITVRLKQTDGARVWCKVSANLIPDAQGRPARLIGSLKNVHNEVEYLHQLQRDAEFDPVTGLRNKRSFYLTVRRLLAGAPDTPFSVLRLDIDRFKVINALYGHDAGDHLLRFIAERLRALTKPLWPCACARLEADVFCLCLPTALAKAILGRLETITDGYELNFTLIPSIGIYAVADRNLAVDVMCDRAKLARDTIKGNYLQRHALFDEAMQQRLLAEQAIVNMMDAALAGEQFKLYLQPKYDLITNTVCGAEALTRWLHPQRGMLPPNEFIPVFERNSFIMKLDEYIWERVCRLLRAELDRGRTPLPISANVSKVNLYNPRLCDILIGLVETYGIPPRLLPLELTESAYTENKTLLGGVMERLQGYGFAMLMDDFGSGYSSLNMLKEIPVDVLKLDLRFLAGPDNAGRGNSIIAAIIRMAHDLNMHVVTEGVETREQVEFLRNLGCTEVQGFYFAKPMPEADYLALCAGAAVD